MYYYYETSFNSTQVQLLLYITLAIYVLFLLSSSKSTCLFCIVPVMKTAVATVFYGF